MLRGHLALCFSTCIYTVGLRFAPACAGSLCSSGCRAGLGAPALSWQPEDAEGSILPIGSRCHAEAVTQIPFTQRFSPTAVCARVSP